jgi:DNA recombination protein RmuC
MVNMEILFIAILIIGFAIVAYLITRQKNNDQVLQLMKFFQESTSQDQKLMHMRLDTNVKIMNEIQKNLGEMSEIGRSMKDLQAFLQNPKLRGNIGEHILKELLGQMLPSNSFYLQHTFRSGEKVDAAIKTGAGIIPIDSKFPMENFRVLVSVETKEDKERATRDFERDVKKHIDAISKKYIVPEEGTIDYALMYIPSEAVYYEIVNNPTLFEYAGEKRVLPVSPTVFYAYIKAILMSLEGQKIEAKAKEILANLKSIEREYQKTQYNLATLERHMGNATNMMQTVMNQFTTLGQKIASTKQLGQKEDIVKN